MNNFCRFLALFFALLPLGLQAQPVSNTVQNADILFASGRIGEAAALYENAGRTENNSELYYKAAECYYQVRDYRKAAECYISVKEEYERYELAGLRYARALKQDGRYEAAAEAFRQFAREYRGERKAQILAVVMNEVKGCELAQQMAQQQMSPVLPAEVKILPKSVNSPENEFAPIAFSDNLLYFSTVTDGRVKLMRTIRQGGAWLPPAAAQGLPESVALRFGNGTFSPDGKRFYCTQCSDPTAGERGGNGFRNQCSLYVLRRTAQGGWSAPERLRDYINMPNQTTTHPFVTQEGGRELLFFASDREGGFGGLDLYVCERPLDSDELDFSFPQNLGNTVNTAGDEVSPFFDPTAQTIWFSSNSHISLGGLDVFKSVRADGKWSKPENVGRPVNSSADDFFFTLKKSGGGFLVSNRTFGSAKTTTRDEDIFEFFPKAPPVTLSGRVLGSDSNQLLADCMVALYELGYNGERRLLEVRPSANGHFQFSILQNRRYEVEATKQGFATASVRPDLNELEMAVVLAPEASQPFFATKDGGGDSVGLADLSPYPTPARQHFIYKVHLEIQPDFNAQAPRYNMARTFGKVMAEPLPEQGIVRILLGDFDDQQSANEVATALRVEGSFPQAFVVREEVR